MLEIIRCGTDILRCQCLIFLIQNVNIAILLQIQPSTIGHFHSANVTTACSQVSTDIGTVCRTIAGNSNNIPIVHQIELFITINFQDCGTFDASGKCRMIWITQHPGSTAGIRQSDSGCTLHKTTRGIFCFHF